MLKIPSTNRVAMLVLLFVVIASDRGNELRADPLPVGIILDGRYVATKEPVEIENKLWVMIELRLEYDLSIPKGEFEKQKCFKKTDVHWIQLLDFSHAADPLTPDPLRPFIDPRKGQNIGKGETGNDTPFYDLTFDKLQDIGKREKAKRDGSGTIFTDEPRTNVDGKAGFTLTGYTLLVGDKGVVDEKNVLGILGGVKWGLKVSQDLKTVEKFKLTGVDDSEEIRKLFNSALEKDFPKWTIKPMKDLCPDMQPRVELVPVPAPSGASLIALGSCLLCAWNRLSRSRHSLFGRKRS